MFADFQQTPSHTVSGLVSQVTVVFQRFLSILTSKTSGPWQTSICEKVRGKNSRENVSVGYSPIALLLEQYPILVLQEPDSCLHLLPSFPPLVFMFGRLLIGSSCLSSTRLLRRHKFYKFVIEYKKESQFCSRRLPIFLKVQFWRRSYWVARTKRLLRLRLGI